MNVLYVGNKLSAHGSALTGIEVLGPLLEARGYTLRYASSKKNKILRLAQMLMATLSCRQWADCVLIDTYSTSNFWYAVAVARICRLFGVPYIPILHGGNLPSRLQKSPWLCKKMFGGAKVNVAPSGYLEKAFADAGFRVRLIPNPVNLENFLFTERPDAKPNLLWVRGLSPMSDPAMAIRVARLVKLNYPDAKLMIVGPDKLKMQPGLEDLAHRLNVEVSFAGKLSQPDWAALSTQYDIFLNTSKVDNAPYSLIEAMALGLYVISTNVGGILYLAQNGRDSLLVGHGEDRLMADAVLRIMGDAELRKGLQKSGFEKSRQFLPASVMPQWDEILLGAL